MIYITTLNYIDFQLKQETVSLSKNKSIKIYYTMGEVCEMFDVNHSLIRFWVSRFNILKPHKNAKGNRLFLPKDIDNLKVIYNLVKERGMTLEGAAKHMAISGSSVEHDVEIAERLNNIKSLLVEIKSELAAFESIPKEGEKLLKFDLSQENQPIKE